jgi:hypothetical protein
VPASYHLYNIPTTYPRDLAKVDSNTRITVVPKHWLNGVPVYDRQQGQMRFFEWCYGANESEWVVANCYEGDEIEFRKYDRDTDTLSPWRHAYFLSSYMYDGITARVLCGSTPTSLFPVFGDEVRKLGGSDRTAAEAGDTPPPSL